MMTMSSWLRPEAALALAVEHADHTERYGADAERFDVRGNTGERLLGRHP
jgi:hypothetical protein